MKENQVRKEQKEYQVDPCANCDLNECQYCEHNTLEDGEEDERIEIDELPY